nr:hypothetical protein CFP56_14666 [Quercus suber]
MPITVGKLILLLKISSSHNIHGIVELNNDALLVGFLQTQLYLSFLPSELRLGIRKFCTVCRQRIYRLGKQ